MRKADELKINEIKKKKKSLVRGGEVAVTAAVVEEKPEVELGEGIKKEEKKRMSLKLTKSEEDTSRKTSHNE